MCDRSVDGQAQEWEKRGITFNEAGTFHVDLSDFKKLLILHAKIMKGPWLTRHGFGVFFQMADAHFVFCINWLNLLALCTYFRGNHSLLSDRRAPWHWNPPGLGEGGMVKGLFWGYAGVIPNFLYVHSGEGGAPGHWILAPYGYFWLCEQVQKVNCAGELLSYFFGFSHCYFHGGQIGSLCSCNSSLA